MGSSLAGVYTTAKFFVLENFNHAGKNDLATYMAIIFARESASKVKFLGQPHTLGRET
jgi:hypothetical protein